MAADEQWVAGSTVVGNRASEPMLVSCQVSPLRYVFWQPIPSMHQLPFLDALADQSDAEVVCAYAEPITEDRLRLGWGDTDTCRVTLMSPDEVEAERMIREAGPETLNVVSGMHCHPAVVRWFRQAAGARAPLALISESYDPRGVKGWIRRSRSLMDAVRYRNRITLLFAMGAVGERWFRQAGFRAESIYPFTYVTSGRCLNHSGHTGSKVRLAFVGQLVPRKGVDLLIRALSMIEQPTWSLTIVGSGESDVSLRRLAEAHGLADRIEWKGAVPNAEVAPILATHDALILPSRYDGWGAVVNEALAVGTPVLCSDACGAADLIASATCGEVFRVNDAAALAAAIRRRIGRGAVASQDRNALSGYATCFSPPVIADYFHRVVQAVFSGRPGPPAPWRNAS